MEGVAFACVFVAITLAHAADDARGSPRWAALRSRGYRRIAHGAALLLVLAATALWQRAEPGPAAFLAIPVALMASGTVVALLGPVSPRLLAVLGIAALPVAALFAVLGVPNG
jgi:hypothetical protein